MLQRNDFISLILYWIHSNYSRLDLFMKYKIDHYFSRNPIKRKPCRKKKKIEDKKFYSVTKFFHAYVRSCISIFSEFSSVLWAWKAVKIANRKARLLVQIERKGVSLERRPRCDIFDQESSVVLSALLTSKRAGRIVGADWAIFLRDCNAEEHIT